MFTQTVTITTDANGDGYIDISKSKPFLFGNLRGYYDPDRVEFFRLYYHILDQASVVQESGTTEDSGSSSGGGSGGWFVMSPPKLTKGIVVMPNQVLRIKIAGGVAFASKTFKVKFDWRFI